MNSKIVGFIISPKKINYKPLLNKEIEIKHIELSDLHISLYYYGKIDNCSAGKNKYSLGFPAHDSLLDSNLLISINENEVIVENDWLGSIPCFYNQSECIISNFPKVCLSNDKTYNEIGLHNYLKYGFCIFEQTPFEQVKFTPFFSSLIASNRSIHIVEKEDPLLKIDSYKGASEKDIWNSFESYISDKENKVSGNIIIPTSAGYDSRMLNYFTHNPERIKNYTYGISAKQEKSFEVKQAKKYAKKLGHDWKQIYLKDSFKYIDEWHDLYAYTTHLHGMYHIEFFNKLSKNHPYGETSLVSGICGDVITGDKQYSIINRPEQVYNLALTHELKFDLNDEFGYSQEKLFIDKHAHLLSDIRLYPVIFMRIKLILLNYLLTIPSMIGIPVWTPFLNFELIMKMLNLPPERRQNRNWVIEFFKHKGLASSRNMFFQDTTNRLNIHLHKNHNFKPISKKLSIKYLTDEHKDEINNYLSKIDFKKEINYKLTTTRIVKEVLKKAGISNDFSRILSDYQTLKAIDMSL